MDTQFDLQSRSFAFKNGRWYDARAVDNFRDRITVELNRLRSENDGLNAKLASYEDQKDALSQSIVLAQETSNRIKADAEAQAQAMLQQVEADAHAQTAKLTEEVTALRAQKEALTDEIANLRRSLLTDLENEVQSLRSGNWSGVTTNAPSTEVPVAPAVDDQVSFTAFNPDAPVQSQPQPEVPAKPAVTPDMTPEQVLASLQQTLQAQPAQQQPVAPETVTHVSQPVVDFNQPNTPQTPTVSGTPEPAYQTVVVFPDDDDEM
jgi:cell division initiation protein